MNFLLIALVSAVLVIGTINTEPKDSEGNKKTQVIVKESSETNPTQEEVKEEVKPEAQAAAEESKEIDSSEDSGTNYLRLALYIFGSILVISTGIYFYLRQRDISSARSATRAPDSPRRDFRKEVKSEPQEEQPAEDENKDLKTEEESNEDEKK